MAVVIGNWLEFYDFLAFSFFAVMIGRAFFPGDSDFGRLLSALATFGVGFVTRPLGAAVIGTYADKAGRRAAMTLTLMLMAVGSGMMGLAPPSTTRTRSLCCACATCCANCRVEESSAASAILLSWL